MDRKQDCEAAFLEDAAQQIAYKPLRSSIIRELQGHIEDRAEEYEAEGMGPDEARKKAVLAMGDGVVVGTELNAVHCVRPNRLLALFSAFLLLGGILSASYMFWSPEQMANGYLYYIPGTALLIFMTYKGYPGLVRYQKPLLFMAVLLMLCEAGYSLLTRLNFTMVQLGGITLHLPLYMIRYYAVLLLGLVLAVALYRLRTNAGKAMAAAVLIPGAVVLLHLYLYFDFILSAMAVFLFSVTGTLLFMIHRNVFYGAKKTLYGLAVAGSLCVLGLFSLLPPQQTSFQAFASPGNHASSMWDDTYNGVLIQDLLSRTPLIGGISLTQSQMMDYGTGEWYFGQAEGLSEYQLQERVKQGTLRRNPYLHYDESTVTLWNILPQHYHNNYLIAVVILLFGWLPGLLFLAVIGAFYAVIFSCILRTRGALAGSVSFYCGLCLLFQSILYVLGNLGYQYAAFTNLPLVSEGKLSIMANMLFLGLIFSAYRYDRVLDLPAAPGSGPNLV